MRNQIPVITPHKLPFLHSTSPDSILARAQTTLLLLHISIKNILSTNYMTNFHLCKTNMQGCLSSFITPYSFDQSNNVLLWWIQVDLREILPPPPKKKETKKNPLKPSLYLFHPKIFELLDFNTRQCMCMTDMRL